MTSVRLLAVLLLLKLRSNRNFSSLLTLSLSFFHFCVLLLNNFKFVSQSGSSINRRVLNSGHCQ